MVRLRERGTQGLHGGYLIDRMMKKTCLRMKYIKCIVNKTKNLLILSCILLVCCNLSTTSKLENQFYGKWECKKVLGWRATKYTSLQLEKIKVSKLIIEKDKFFFGGIEFIDTCNGIEWRVKKVDSLTTIPQQLEVLYDSNEISELYTLEPFNKEGNYNCYNNCAELFLKRDTLINICGGYTLFFIKVKDD